MGLFWLVGVSGILLGSAHLFTPAPVAKAIGWPTSRFQWEVGLAPWGMDRQYFIQSLAVCRNLSVACATLEQHDSDLRKKCEKLYLAIDEVVGELVGDSSYLRVREWPSRA